MSGYDITDISIVEPESVFKKRVKIYRLLQNGIVDISVLNELLSDGTKFDERDLWDFKESLPHRNETVRLSASARSTYDYKVDAIVKDVIAFHNSNGGYIIIGVKDSSRIIPGFSVAFDVDGLNRRVFSVTGRSIECIYRLIDYLSADGMTIRLGLLFIPKRDPTELPVQCQENSHADDHKHLAFRRGEFYLRQRDECRPARSPEDYDFLNSAIKRQVIEGSSDLRRMMENNLPSRDGELGQFIGRDADLVMLWKWISDPFSPVKLISRLGGVGKTSLAYNFSEYFIYSCPPQYDKLVWLGAKQRNWLASRDEYTTSPRVDFFSVETLLQKLVVELGCPDEIACATHDVTRLTSLVVDHVRQHRFLVVIDNVDTLEDENQQILYHNVMIAFATAGSKALITARRNLGMPRGHYIELEGISRAYLYSLVVSKPLLLKVSVPVVDGSADLDELYEVSHGSPLFIVSILRLLSLGVTYKDALKQWRGAAGERVREAAFAKEVSRLKASEARTLLAAVYLEETSLVELTSVLKISQYEVQNAMDRLRDFSMVTVASQLPGGATISVPKTLTLTTSVIESRVTDYKQLSAACAEQRQLHQDPAPFVQNAIRRAIAFLQEEEEVNAVDTMTRALERLPSHPDLLCMLGRCKLAVGSHLSGEAIEAFDAAEKNGCSKVELFNFG